MTPRPDPARDVLWREMAGRAHNAVEMLGYARPPYCLQAGCGHDPRAHVIERMVFLQALVTHLVVAHLNVLDNFDAYLSLSGSFGAEILEDCERKTGGPRP